MRKSKKELQKRQRHLLVKENFKKMTIQFVEKKGKQAFLGDVIENAYRNFTDRERRLVSFNLPEGVMIDSEIHEAAKDVSETQRLMEDPRVQRVMDEIVKLYDDLRNVSSVILSRWEEQHKTETDPITIDEDAVDPKIVHLDAETTTIEFKDIHMEIVSKVKINLDWGEKDVDNAFVSKTLKGNKSRMNEMPELYQVVTENCFVKYNPFKHEVIVKFEGPLMITRDDTTSLAPTTLAQMIKSNIVQCWSFLMNDSRLKEDPSCFFFGIDHSRSLELSLRSQDASQPTDKKNRGEVSFSTLTRIESGMVEKMSNFLKRINHEKADEILEYEFDEVNFKWKTPRYTLDCGVFAMIHMMCFSGETFDSDLDLANRRKVYYAEICATLALADINTKRKQLERKISRFRVVRKLEKEKGVEDMICVSDFLKKHKEVMDNMSLQCYQVINYLAINDGENFPNKSEVVGWFIDSIEIGRQDCNALLNEWKVSSNVITAWSNHLNNIEMEKDRSENDLVRYFFGFNFVDALTMCLNAHGKNGVTSLQKLWIDWNTSQSLDLDAAECVFISLKLEDHYFLAVINFKDETIDHLDITFYETNEEYEPIQSFILEPVIQVQKLFKKRKHPQANDMLSYKLRIIELPFQKEREDNFSASYLLLHMKVYDGANDIGLGTIAEEFARLNHHHIRTVLDLLLNGRHKMKQKLLTNVEDWEYKKESEQFSAAVASTSATATSNSAANATVANAMSM
uniref:Ubiquitin-like protease family profile domain-containing protein n=1 Tax=Chenopodium quinoa TaxID=63459 RepID=A0A803MTC5_CHEQI